MLRRLLIEFVLFATPFLLYYGARLALRLLRPDISAQPPVPPGRIVQLTMAGVGLAVAGFAVAVFVEPRHDGEVYLPAHLENGELVPGRYARPPAPTPTAPPAPALPGLARPQEKPAPAPDTDRVVLEGHP
jgi:hypothetical protein